MSRSKIRLAALAAAGLLLAACGGANDTAEESSTPADTGEAQGDDADAGEAQGDDADAGEAQDADGGGDTDGDDTAGVDADAGEAQDADGGGDTDGDDAAGDDMDDMDAEMDGDMDMSGAYGEPADPSEADRTIEVMVDNDLAFKPDEYEVAAGEVVTFRIANSGDIEHEFVLGDEQAQQQMAEEMDDGDGHAHSGEMSNAVTIHPGEEAELVWRFPDEPTTVLVGCHVSGHWEAGMQGSVTVG